VTVTSAAPGIDLEARSANGNTALMMAAYKHKREAVDALLAKGAKVNQSGWTALHYAASAGDLPIMKILLDREAVVDALAPADITPLMFAAREGQEGAVKLLLSWGADASLKSGHGWTAVQFAQAADKPGVVAIITAAQQARARANKYLLSNTFHASAETGMELPLISALCSRRRLTIMILSH